MQELSIGKHQFIKTIQKSEIAGVDSWFIICRNWQNLKLVQSSYYEEDNFLTDEAMNSIVQLRSLVYLDIGMPSIIEASIGLEMREQKR